MGKDQIMIVATITSTENGESKLKELLNVLVTETRHEKGCKCYDLHVSLTDPTLFVMYEIWENREALNAHQNSSHFKAYKEKAIEVMKSINVVELVKIII